MSAHASERDLTTHGVKWALHLAIAASADLSVLDELIELAMDAGHGRNRAVFVDALALIDDSRAAQALEALANDPDLRDDWARIRRARKGQPKASR